MLLLIKMSQILLFYSQTFSVSVSVLFKLTSFQVNSKKINLKEKTIQFNNKLFFV